MPADRRARRRLLTASLGAACAIAAASCDRAVTAGFYFEPVTYASRRLGGALTGADLPIIEAVARDELARAFAGMRLDLTGGRDARYRVAVAQEVRDRRSTPGMFVAGESRAITGVGGQGAVNFSLLASAALSCAPEGADRQVLLEAIGRGVGRAAAHEFAHQLLPLVPIHESKDVASYEYGSAGRCQQYFGPMHWDLAGPHLRARLGG
jgi:hypothetical protein